MRGSVFPPARGWAHCAMCGRKAPAARRRLPFPSAACPMRGCANACAGLERLLWIRRLSSFGAVSQIRRTSRPNVTSGSLFSYLLKNHGCDEVDTGERPEPHVGAALLVECAGIGIDAYEAFHSPCGRNAVGERIPERGHGEARPCESGQEQEHYGREHDVDEAIFAPAQAVAEHHPEHGGCRQEWQNEKNPLQCLALMRQMEPYRHEMQGVYGGGEIEENVCEGAAEDGGERRHAAVGRRYASPAAFFLGAAQQADSKYHALL